VAGRLRGCPNRRWAKKHRLWSVPSLDVVAVRAATSGDWGELSIHGARISEMRALARRMLVEDVVAVREEIGQMDKQEEREGMEAPVFSMRVKSAKVGEHEEALGSDIARALTGFMTAGRGGIGGLIDVGTRLGAIVAERGGDLAAQLSVATFVDDLYALLGIASTRALVELDERVDDVELKMDHVARQRTREELMLLHQRLGELEAAVRSRGIANDPVIDLGGVMGRLNEIESRIDEIP